MRTPVENRPKYELVDCFLRLFVAFLSAVSIWLAVTNQQDNPDYGKLKFNTLLGIRYMVCISAISGGYALCALLSAWIRFLVTRVWIYFVTDQVVAYLMVTSVGAVVEILYLAYNGDQKVTWSEVCSSYGRFCSRLKLALGLHALALCCFSVIAVFSAFRFFTRFDPPLPPNKEVEEERT